MIQEEIQFDHISFDDSEEIQDIVSDDKVTPWLST